MPPRTAKQKAATRRLVASNRVRRGGGRRRTTTTRRRSTAHRSSPGTHRRRAARPSRTRFGKTFSRFSHNTAVVSGAVGAANPVVGVLSGRTITHPLTPWHDSGELRTGTNPNVSLRQPWTGVDSNQAQILLDPISYLTKRRVLNSQPPGFGSQVRAFGAAISYNIRSSLRGGTAVALFGPTAAGLGVMAADAFVTPFIVDGINALGRIAPRRRRA